MNLQVPLQVGATGEEKAGNHLANLVVRQQLTGRRLDLTIVVDKLHAAAAILPDEAADEEVDGLVQTFPHEAAVVERLNLGRWLGSWLRGLGGSIHVPSSIRWQLRHLSLGTPKPTQSLQNPGIYLKS